MIRTANRTAQRTMPMTRSVDIWSRGCVACGSTQARRDSGWKRLDCIAVGSYCLLVKTSREVTVAQYLDEDGYPDVPKRRATRCGA